MARFRIRCSTPFFPSASELGPNVAFRGSFEWLQDTKIWNAKLAGRLEDVSWGQLTSTLPYELTGRGHIDMQNAFVADGRIMSMQGTITAQSGRINRDWLQLSQEWLGLGVDPDVLRQSIATVPFEAMRVGFQLDGNGIYLQGNSVVAPKLRIEPHRRRPGRLRLRPHTAEPIAIDNLMNWLTATPADHSSIRQASHQNLSPTVRQAADGRTRRPAAKSLANTLTNKKPEKRKS